MIPTDKLVEEIAGVEEVSAPNEFKTEETIDKPSLLVEEEQRIKEEQHKIEQDRKYQNIYNEMDMIDKVTSTINNESLLHNWFEKKVALNGRSYDVDFIQNDGFEEILKDPKYSDFIKERPDIIEDIKTNEGTSKFDSIQAMDFGLKKFEENKVHEKFTTSEQILGSVASVFADPSSYGTGVGIANRIHKLKKLSTTKTGRFVKEGVITGGIVTAYESVLASNNDYYTYQEAMINGVIGGILGGGLAAKFGDEISNDVLLNSYNETPNVIKKMEETSEEIPSEDKHYSLIQDDIGEENYYKSVNKIQKNNELIEDNLVEKSEFKGNNDSFIFEIKKEENGITDKLEKELIKIENKFYKINSEDKLTESDLVENKQYVKANKSFYEINEVDEKIVNVKEDYIKVENQFYKAGEVDKGLINTAANYTSEGGLAIKEYQNNQEVLDVLSVISTNPTGNPDKIQGQTLDMYQRDIMNKFNSLADENIRNLDRSIRQELKKNPNLSIDLVQEDLPVDELITKVMRRINDNEFPLEESNIPKSMQEYIAKDREYRVLQRKELEKFGITYADESIYVKRQFDPNKSKIILEQIGGKVGLKKLILDSRLSALKKNGVEITPEVKKISKEISNKYASNIMALVTNSKTDVVDYEVFENQLKKELEDFIDTYEGNLSKEDLNNVIYGLKNEEQVKYPGFTNKRLLMDELKEFDINGTKVKLEDLLVNSHNKLSRSLNGTTAISLSKLKYGKIITKSGVKLDLNNKKSVAEFRQKHIIDKGEDPKQFDKILEVVNNGGFREKQIGSGNINKIGRILSNILYAKLLPSVWISQGSEAGNVLGFVGMKRVWNDFPEVYDFLQKVSNNNVSKEDKEFFIEFADTFKELNDTKTAFRSEEELYYIEGDTTNKLGKAIDKAVDVSDKVRDFSINEIGRLKYMTVYSRMLFLRSLQKGWIESALKGKRPFNMSDERIKGMGLTLEEFNEINKLLKDNYKDNTKQGFMNNIDSWENNLLRDKFLSALRTKTNEMIINPTSLEGLAIAKESMLGKMAFMLQSFTINAFTKNGLKSLKYKDREATALFLTQMAVMSVLLTGKNYANYSNDPEKLKEKMKPENFLKQVFLSTTGAGSLGAISDNIFSLAPGYEGVGGSRNTLPMFDFIGDMYGIADIALDPDKEINKRYLGNVVIPNIFYLKAKLISEMDD